MTEFLDLIGQTGFSPLTVIQFVLFFFLLLIAVWLYSQS